MRSPTIAKPYPTGSVPGTSESNPKVIPPEEALTKALIDMGEAIGIALRSMCENLEPVWGELAKCFEKVWTQIYPMLRQRYDDAGAPYGPLDEGMWRFLEEEEKFRKAIEAHRQVLVWKKALANLRMRGRCEAQNGRSLHERGS